MRRARRSDASRARVRRCDTVADAARALFPLQGIPGAENVDAAASRRAYGALVEHIDEQIARFLGFLEESGELNDTVVVVMGDHGEHLGDHSEFAKACAGSVA